ncbi:MAG: TonB-dependent siderophore receptor [Thermoanaerobaculia bacterium]
MTMIKTYFRDAMIALVAIALLAAPAVAAEKTEAAASEAVVEAETVSEEPSSSDGDSDKPRLTIREELLVEDRAPYLPETVSTATKTSVPLHLLPASVSSLSHSLLRDRNALVLGDALTNVARVNAQSNAGVHDLFFMRGFDSLSSSLVLTDGAPDPEATFYQLYNVERVEVVRGPAGFLYGGNTVAGTVNLVRKRPYGGYEGRLGVLAGSHATTRTTLDLNYGKDDGSLGFRLNGLWLSSDGYRDDKASKVFAVNPVISFVPNDRTSVTFSADFLSSDFKPDSGIPLLFNQIPDVPREASYQTPFDFSDQNQTRLRLDVVTRVGSRLTLRNKIYFSELDWQSKGTLITAAFPGFAGVDVFRVRNVLDDRQQFFGNQFDAVFTLGSGSVLHKLVAGVEIARLADDLRLDIGLLPTIDLFDPVETAPETDFLIPGFGTTADARTVVVAPYLMDEIQFSDRWHLFVGARYDSLDFKDDAVGLDKSDGQLSPFVGVLFAPIESLSIYANYGEAFSAPSTLVAGQDREPEEARQVEVGIKHRTAGGKLRTTLAFYDLEKEKIAIVDATGVTAQLGDQQSRGVELEISSSVRQGLHWTFSYAYTDAELTRFTEFDPFFLVIVDRSGNQPAYTPEHLANFWISQRFANGFGISGGARYVSEQFIDEDNAFEIADYVTLDALLSYERQSWGARVHLRNLTDEEYLGRGFGSASVLPADGFNVMAGFYLGW